MPCWPIALLVLSCFGPSVGFRRFKSARKQPGKGGWADELGWPSRGAQAVNEADTDVEAPVCITEVGSERQRCKLLSQKLCSNASTRASRTDGRLGTCFARRRTCAVVGSSQHLLNVTLGRMIDSHEVVIRINGAPAGSTSAELESNTFGPHVGTRTDVRFLNGVTHMPDVSSAHQQCVFLQKPALPRECGRHCADRTGACNATCSLNGMRCVARGYTEPDFDWKHHHVFMDHFHIGIAERVTNTPTAGISAIIFALGVCDRVTILGFGPSCSGDAAARYYDNPVAAESYRHDGQEFDLLQRASATIPLQPQKWIVAKDVNLETPFCVHPQYVRSLGTLFEVFGSELEIRHTTI